MILNRNKWGSTYVMGYIMIVFRDFMMQTADVAIKTRDVINEYWIDGFAPKCRDYTNRCGTVRYYGWPTT